MNKPFSRHLKQITRADYLKLADLEPKLLILLEETEKIGRQKNTNKLFEHFYHKNNSIKKQLSKLVGYGSSKEDLATSEAYDIVYEYLFSILDGGEMFERVKL